MSLDSSVFMVSSNQEVATLIKQHALKRLEAYSPSMLNSNLYRREVKASNDGFEKRYFEATVISKYLSRTSEWQKAKKGSIQIWYSKSIETKKYTLSLGMSLEVKIGSRDEFEIEKQINFLSRAAKDSKNLDLTHVLTFAKSSSYVDRDDYTVNNTCADGLPIVSASHTLRGTSGTYSTVTGDPEFSVTALETLEKSFIENSYDNLGNVVNIIPDTIFHTNNPALVNSINTVLQSTASITDNKNSGVINPYRARFKSVTLDDLNTTATGGKDVTKNKAWGLAASDYTDLILLEHEGLMNSFEDEYDKEESTYKFYAKTQYGVGIVTPKWIRLCFPA